jgi:hypothetical protein
MNKFCGGTITSPSPNGTMFVFRYTLYKCDCVGVSRLLQRKTYCHIAPKPPATGFGSRRRKLDFFSFFRFTDGFLDGGAFLLPARTFRDGGASVAATAEGGILPDAIICSSSSRWYAWCNVNSDRCTCELNMCGR